MFTGIVEELGTVRSIVRNAGGARLVIEAETVLGGARPGDSIAVNGCCLTVAELGTDGTSWAADAVPETLDRTTLGELRSGSHVNLERPVRLQDRLGGHLVQGHVDGVATLTRSEPLDDGSVRLTIAVPPALLRYVVEKGSVALDGTSLTVAALTDTGFDIAVIPHTLAHTTLGGCRPGDRVNVEVDVLAKYVERLTSPLIHRITE